MEDPQIRAALERHWTASAAGNQDAEHEIYHDDAIVSNIPNQESASNWRNPASSAALFAALVAYEVG